MSNYSSLFNQSFVDVDSLTTNTIISDSLILTAESDQLQIGQTIISDTWTSTTRVGTIPAGADDFEFVTTASGSQIINGDNTWTGINTFTSISGVHLNLLTPLSGSTVAIKGYQQGVIHSDNSGTLTSSLIVDSDISGQLSYNKVNLTNSVTNGDLFGGIMYGKLILSGMVSNNDIHPTAGIPYSKITLTNSIVNGDIEGSAAIDYTKLSLSGKITNNDIVASANIPYSKLSVAASIRASDINSISGTNGQVLTASGGLASWTTVTATNATNALNIDINTYPYNEAVIANRLPFYTNSGDGYNALKSSSLLYYVEKAGTISPVTPEINRLYTPSINCSGNLINNGDILVTNGNVTLSNGSIQLNGNIETTAGTFFGPLSGNATSATSSTLQTLNTDDTTIATTSFIQRALENILTMPIKIATTGGYLNNTNTTSSASRLFTSFSEHPRALTATTAAPYIIYFNSDDYAATIGTYTPKLRLTSVISTNGSSLSGINILTSFRPITSSGSVSNGIAYTIGSVVGGLSISLSSPAANTRSILTATTSGLGGLSGMYCFSVFNTAAFPTNTNASISVNLDVIYS